MYLSPDLAAFIVRTNYCRCYLSLMAVAVPYLSAKEEEKKKDWEELYIQIYWSRSKGAHMQMKGLFSHYSEAPAE